jgi:hypothetical protein
MRRLQARVTHLEPLSRVMGQLPARLRLISRLLTDEID